MGMLFTVVLGISPVIIFLYLMVSQQQEERSAKIDVAKVDMVIEVEKFNEAFEQTEMEFADTNESKVYHEQKRDEHKKNSEIILEERIKVKERAKELRKRSEENWLEQEEILDNFDSDDDLSLDDKEFSDKEFDF